MTCGTNTLPRILMVILASALTSGWSPGQDGVNLPGKDMKPGFDLPQPDPDLCKKACDEDPNCKAYTYVKPGIQGPNARCWLKSEVPQAVKDPCCVSGVKTYEVSGVLLFKQNPPAITSVRPTEPDGGAYITAGGPLIIEGNNFSPDPSKNKIVIGKLSGAPSTPPPPQDVLAEIGVSQSTGTRIETTANASLPKSQYLLWLFVQGGGYSAPVKVWFAPKPGPLPPMPTITSIDPAAPCMNTVIHGGTFDPQTHVTWGTGLSDLTEYLNDSAVKTRVPCGLPPGPQQVKVEVNGMPSAWFNFTTSAPKPLNLYWTDTDLNGIPMNAKWGWQLVRSSSASDFYPDIPKLCPGNNCGSLLDQPQSKAYGNFGCGPHINWKIPVTYDGFLKWSSHSAPGTDDDYNFYLFTSGGAGATASTANPGGIMTEFDSDETIDHFVTPWWNEFHDAVDHNQSKAKYMVDRKYAIVTALPGFDCAHDCYIELHPVWAMAIRVKDSPEPDDEEVWSMFVRNWGNEGYCGTGQHYLGLDKQGEDRYNYAFLLPWRPGATSVAVAKEDFLTGSDNPVEGPYVTPIPGKGIRVSWYLAEGTKRPFVNGQLHLKWAGSPQAHIVDQRAMANVNAASGITAGEDQAIAQRIIQSVPAEQQAAFTADIASLMAKPAITIRSTKPNLKSEGQVSLTPRAVMPQVHELADAIAERRTVQLKAALDRRRGVTNVTPVDIEMQRRDLRRIPTLQEGVNLPGGDYKNFPVSGGPEDCRSACADDPVCLAYTWVRPGVQGPQAQCWLKSSVPAAVADKNCTSGTKSKSE